MPDLFQSLQGRDRGHLRIVAGFWELELNAPDARVGLQRLATALLERARVQAVIVRLPEAAGRALQDLLHNEGRLPWALFIRRYGPLREMGPGRRDRERPYLNQNASPAEALWYRGLVGRAFLETGAGPEEFAFIPDDLLGLIPVPGLDREARPGRTASPAERAVGLPASDRILDHACTLLAALRLGEPLDSVRLGDEGAPYPLTAPVLKTLLVSAGMLDADSLPRPEPTRAFLEAGRGEALALLAQAWLESALFNELRLLPRLACEGEWQNEPQRARQAILDFLSTLPGGFQGPESGAGNGERSYWSLGAFVAGMRSAHPDFQRPAGDYDSWYIRDLESGEYLRGFEHWDEVDGTLIRYMIAGPLHWLGIVDLATPAHGEAGPNGREVTAFRFSAWGSALLRGQAAPGLPLEDQPIHARSDGRIHVPNLAPRAVRYQLARFSIGEGEKHGVYQYRLTPGSLERARQQGLRVAHLLALLRRHTPGVPPALARALERWDTHGAEARLEQVVVLRLGSPELLASLRSSRVGRFLGDPLGPTTVIVQAGAWQKVVEYLAERGYLADVRTLTGETEGE